jgi:hypothetical protein
MNRLLHWLHDYPFTAIAAVLLPLWQYGTSTANSLTTLAQASAYGSMGDIASVIKDFGLGAVMLIFAIASIRELWVTLKPEVLESFKAYRETLQNQKENGVALRELLTKQGEQLAQGGKAMRRVERQGKATTDCLKELIRVTASGVGAMKGTDTVSVIERASANETGGE